MPDGTIRTRTCPPQDRAVGLFNRLINNDTSPRDADILSGIRQEMRGLCPDSEKALFIDSNFPLVHPTRNQHYNPRVTPSTRTPDANYVMDRLNEKRRIVR